MTSWVPSDELLQKIGTGREMYSKEKEEKASKFRVTQIRKRRKGKAKGMSDSDIGRQNNSRKINIRLNSKEIRKDKNVYREINHEGGKQSARVCKWEEKRSSRKTKTETSKQHPRRS